MPLRHTFNRRQLLALGSLILAQPLVSCASLSTPTGVEGSLYLSAASDRDDQHWVKGFTLHDGQVNLQFKQALPGRAHHIAVHQENALFVVVARRPGRYLLVGDLNSGEVLANIDIPQDRHLFGHGIFSADGEYFYCPESDYQNAQGESGRVAVWSVQKSSRKVSFERVQDFPSYGVGPHELLLMPDQKTLVLANGGIRTHPDSGREKLNLDSMRPSLVYIDAQSGKLLEKRAFFNEFHQASIRHLDVNATGKVVLAMQYEGEPFKVAPLLATHQQGQDLKVFKVPEMVRQTMKQYVGSTRFDSSGRFIAASCPRGNMITLWDAESGEFIEKLKSRDGCGVCATQDGFLFTAGTGRINHYNLDLQKLESVDVLPGQEKTFWDNHLTKAELA